MTRFAWQRYPTPMRLLVVAPVLAVALSTLTGCGPILSTMIIVRAEAALEGAEAADAEKYATYEYTAAREYLHKAREEQGYADFGPAIDFATKAETFAQKSLERAAAAKGTLTRGSLVVQPAPAAPNPSDNLPAAGPTSPAQETFTP